MRKKLVKDDLIVVRVTGTEKRSVQEQAAKLLGGQADMSAYLLHLHREQVARQHQYEFRLGIGQPFI